MTSFGVVCAGPSSEVFTAALCQTCHDYQAQKNVVLVGVHPGSGNAKNTVDKLKSLGFRAATAERQNATVADIVALTTLLDMFNGITVPIPDLIMLILDEEFMTDPMNPDLIAQSWQTIRTFKDNHPLTEIIAVYFTRRNRYNTALDQMKDLFPKGRNTAFGAPLAHMLLIGESASLREKFANEYRQILAHHLAILLVAEATPTFSVSFRQQIQRIKTPFVGMALDEIAVPPTWAWAAALQGGLPQKSVKEFSLSLVNAIVDVLNRSTPQTSFDEIGPAARKGANEMLAINIFTPPIPEQDRIALDSAVQGALYTYSVDGQGIVVKRQQPHVGEPTFDPISCSIVELVKANALLSHIPVIDRLSFLQSREKSSQILVFFAVEGSHTP